MKKKIIHLFKKMYDILYPLIPIQGQGGFTIFMRKK